MKITDDEVLRVALLAYLLHERDDEFIGRFQSDIESILDHVSSFQSENTNGVDYLDGLRFNGIEDLRDDVPAKDHETYERVRRAIIDAFPEKQGDLLVVKAVFDQ